MTERIDHAQQAREWLDGAESVRLTMEESAATGAIAQAHATLALVEQQRIANLIALSEFRDLPGGGQKAYAIYEHKTFELRQDIREGLGL